MRLGTGIEVLHLAAPVLALALMALAHAVVCRRRPSAPVLNSLFISGVIGAASLPIAVAATVLLGEGWGDSLLGLVFIDGPIYGLLAYCYANFVNLGHSSVRIRIYRELLESRGGVVVSLLRERYDEAGMLSVRLQRMLEAGDLAFDGSSYRLRGTRLLLISRVIFSLKRVVLGRNSEFSQ